MKLLFTPNEGGLRRLQSIPEALQPRLSDPALLRALGATHRKQEVSIFSTEGAAGAGGPWEQLNPRYRARKAKAVGGRKKILELTGTMKAAFTRATSPDYFQQFIPRGALGIFRFGARSSVAAAHKAGNPLLAPAQSATARKVFGGRAPRLARRDMVTKTPVQLAEMRETLLTWFVNRMKQGLRGAAALGGRA